jgi:hypothetical protein
MLHGKTRAQAADAPRADHSNADFPCLHRPALDEGLGHFFGVAFKLTAAHAALVNLDAESGAVRRRDMPALDGQRLESNIFS